MSILRALVFLSMNLLSFVVSSGAYAQVTEANAEVQSKVESKSMFEVVGSVPDTRLAGYPKSDCMFIFVHGLYGDKEQFRSYAKAFTQFGCLSALITLPGHGPDEENSDSVTKQEWQSAVRHAVNRSQKYSRHAFLVGQSTGGALALIEAIRQQDEGRDFIKGLWLIEPALRVRPAPHLGACLSQALIGDVRKWPRAAGLFGVNINKTTPKLSPKMGCEVDSIWKSFLDQRYPQQSWSQSAQAQERLTGNSDLQPNAYEEFMLRTRAAVAELRIPVYVENTLGDLLVDEKIIEGLKALKNVFYNETGASIHGERVANSFSPVGDLAYLVRAGFNLPEAAYNNGVRSLMFTAQFYAAGSPELKASPELGESRLLEALLVLRNQSAFMVRPECRDYLELVERLRDTKITHSEYQKCYNTFQ